MKQLYDIWFSHVMGVNCVNGRQIAASGFGPRLFYNCRNDLKQFNVFTERQMETAAATSIDDVREIYDIHQQNGICSVNCSENEFPQRLKSVSHTPLVLFYKGDLSLLSADCTVGIVGSRRCNAEGEKACSMIAEDVAKEGAVIISGLAQGVDSIAHKSCVAAGGRTVAFLGTPLDEYFPKTNKSFQDKLSTEHLVVSEYHCTYPYYSANFIYRNRLIAAASDALCVVQARQRSGSLSTVNRAREYDKPVFVLPGSVFSPAYTGSNQLLVDGVAFAVTNGSQILDYLGYTGKRVTEIAVSDRLDYSSLDETSLQILQAMDGAMNTNAIIRFTGLKAAVVKAALTSLEIGGWIARSDTGEYIRTK